MSERKLTTFYLYKNTPMNDFINTIYFNDEMERDNFFRSTYDYLKVTQPFNFIRDRSTLRVTGEFKDFKDINYCSFTSMFDDITYYAFIPEYKYINDNVIELNLVIDGIMTFCQGDTLEQLKGVTVKRQHLTERNYNKYLPYIRNNNDIIKTHTKKYFFEATSFFKDFNVLIHSSVDLNKPFGNMDNPEMRTSNGGTVDFVTSPVDLYLIEEDDFSFFMEKLADYPWITQNFKKIILIPKAILNKDMDNLKVKEVNNPDVDLKEAVKITGGATTNFKEFTEKLSLSMDQIMELIGLDKVQDRHLLRSEYVTIELYDWTGQRVIVDPGQLKESTGLYLEVQSIGGYNNEMVVYLKNYKSSVEGISSYKNDSIMFNSFDEIPILIDSYDLALSKSAHSRQYRESNLLTNKIDRILNPNNNLQDRLVSSISVLSNISPLSVGRGLVDEHEFYRQQLAQEKDLALESPIISNQSTNNALNKKYDKYGITVKMSKPNEEELEKVRKYYCLFGYELDIPNTEIDSLDSMAICNYLEIEGNFSIPYCERSLLEVIRLRLENGVRFWHNKAITNPFTQRVEYNRRIK